MSNSENYHKSVLFEEVLEGLSVIPGEIYLDTTFGGGGHSLGILNSGGIVVALDTDNDAIENAKKNFDLGEKSTGVWVTKDGKLTLVKANFKDLDYVIKKNNFGKFAGVIFDLGVSSFMLDNPDRGFSFSKIGPLDMRMDQTLAVKASDLLNALNEGELYDLFIRLGEESNARRIARGVIQYRLEKKFETTTEFSNLIKQIIGPNFNKKIDPSTKVFMALRIAVNDELNVLKTALPKATNALRSGGRLAVISFHSMEDRIVKDYFKKETTKLKILNDKPITAATDEVKKNARSRSAKLRVAERK